MPDNRKKQSPPVQPLVPWDQRDRANFAFDGLMSEFDRLVRPEPPKTAAAQSATTPAIQKAKKQNR